MNIEINITTDMLSIINTIIAFITAIIAIITIIKGYFEYKLQNKQKRMEFYEKYRKQLKEEERFKRIITGLDTDSEDLKNIPRIDKYYFLGFYEDIAILIKNNLIKPNIAHYMFGYYAIRCLDSKNFWNDINRQSIYWSLFNEFAEEMKRREENKKAYLNLKI